MGVRLVAVSFGGAGPVGDHFLEMGEVHSATHRYMHLWTRRRFEKFSVQCEIGGSFRNKREQTLDIKTHTLVIRISFHNYEELRFLLLVHVHCQQIKLCMLIWRLLYNFDSYL